MGILETSLLVSLPPLVQNYHSIPESLMGGKGILIPACLDVLRGAKSPITRGPVHLVAAGGIIDGRGLAASLTYGAQAVRLYHWGVFRGILIFVFLKVWVGTRFVASVEAVSSTLFLC